MIRILEADGSLEDFQAYSINDVDNDSGDDDNNVAEAEDEGDDENDVAEDKGDNDDNEDDDVEDFSEIFEESPAEADDADAEDEGDDENDVAEDKGDNDDNE